MCNGPFISPDLNHSSRNSRASAGCNFGQTAGPSLIKFGTREGGREGGRGGEGREGRGGEGRGGGGGEGTVHTFHKPEPL